MSGIKQTNHIGCENVGQEYTEWFYRLILKKKKTNHWTQNIYPSLLNSCTRFPFTVRTALLHKKYDVNEYRLEIGKHIHLVTVWVIL